MSSVQIQRRRAQPVQVLPKEMVSSEIDRKKNGSIKSNFKLVDPFQGQIITFVFRDK